VRNVSPVEDNLAVQIAAAYDPEGFRDRGFVQRLDDAGGPAEPVRAVPDLEAEIGRLEPGSGAAPTPRWIWPATTDIAPQLLRRGVRVDRCWDLALTEGLLLSHEGRAGAPRSLGAAWARLHGRPVPEDHGEGALDAPMDSPVTQPALFEPDRSGLPPEVPVHDAVREVYADQQRRIARTEYPARFRLLVAAESAAALAAAEMAHHGLPWHAGVHGEILESILGPRPLDGTPPRAMVETAALLAEALGVRALNPDSQPQVTKAFADVGVRLGSLRRYELRDVDHPAIPILLKYKELSRLNSFNGWTWRDTWVVDGRFRPEYTVGGVVTGRWAARGGGARQIARLLRRAVIADPGWILVVADAAQLEPRILAAVSGDPGMAEATQSDDMYSALADVFEGSRDKAKIGLLGAMYGATGAYAAAPLALMRRRFPAATAVLEAAAREGERGRLVRSYLGRTCPPPSDRWRSVISGGPEPGGFEAGGADPGGGVDDGGADPGDDATRRSGQAARRRGRFARNFVIQATAAEWAEVLLALLRQRLRDFPEAGRPELVFFQHDEVLIHAPAEHGPAAAGIIKECAAEAGRLVFGDTPVRFPMSVHSVECYGDAK
jgi:DNA polymerase-1